ncbi:hypothetical protein QTI24_05570 [Variovorax sp. J22P240]|uniref:hypothetical protein n=1 Tax=Variovorax sp. J22P240 TaxID=3053514 RepID=UPI0025751E36|nr:hypothetical protein [Variovorax sp. J22P240]MDL9998063.1 hypothetical protein [Variovorax sp. J22P240]
MDGRETNAEQRRFITDTESTNSHENPCADLRWTESLSHPLCIATGRELTIRDSDVAATDLALEKGDDLVNGQLVPDFPMNFYQHLGTPRSTNCSKSTTCARSCMRRPCSSTRLVHSVAQRQSQVAALNMLGRRQPFDISPFFWSQHYDVAIQYVGHAECWDSIQKRLRAAAVSAGLTGVFCPMNLPLFLGSQRHVD